MRRILLLVGVGTLLLGGCATQRMSGEQLARVAKDWSLSIRASQVVPVYPLTEDLLPGDVFLVQTPIDEQVKVYLSKGFLPLENLVARLPAKGYDAFYSGWPGVDGSAVGTPPRPWQFPRKDGTLTPSDFATAPLAAFPTYNFSVSRSDGLNVAIPVQSVPIGLDLLDSASATGAITLKDTYTYALPGKAMFDSLIAWAKDNGTYLRQFGPRTDASGKVSYSYLRVVNRVYLVKSVNVSLFSNRATGVSGSAGVPRPVDLLNLGSGSEAAARFDQVNEILSKASPQPEAAQPAAGAPGMAVGGSVKLAMAGARSVSLVETFARPLVIGYMAFDYPIQPDGTLGPSMATLAALEGRAAPTVTKFQGCDADCERIEQWLSGNPANNQALADWLKARGIDKKPTAILYDSGQQDLRARIVKDLIPK